MERQHYIETNRHEIGQAESMARVAGIELTTDEILTYAWARNEPDFIGMCDQAVLDICLPADKQAIFEQQFKNVRF